MKLKKPNQKSFTDAGALLAGALGGALVADGAFKALQPKDATDNTVKLIRAGMAVAGVALAASVTGTDTGATTVKGAGIGVAVVNAVALVRSFAKENSAVQTAASGPTKGGKFIAGAFGLNCACDGSGLNGSRRKRQSRHLRGVEYTPSFDMEQTQIISLNPLEQLVQQGAMAV